MTQYKLSGKSESGVTSVLELECGSVEVRQSVQIEPVVRDGGPEVTVEIEDDDLLEIELEDGFFLWTTSKQLQEDTEQAGMRVRGDDSFPTQYPIQRRGTERGTVANSIRAVKVLGYDLPEAGARLAAKKVEAQLAGDGQFFRVAVDGALSREDPAATNANEPTLVLIHGTASSTANAYAGFFKENKKIWEEIHEHYDGRVYGFEHRTLSKNPLQNALEFLSAIPTDANLHLVTHSRGGLVGDLIAHGRVGADVFAAEDLERELGRAFKEDKELYAAQLALYQDFNRLIAAAAPNVSRYIRVGCPAAGTTLASGRLDIYLSIVVNLLRKIPGVGPILGGLGELTAAVAKERTKPDVLPGLEAQMPKSAFVRLLNGSEHELDTDLTVLAGDSDGFFKNLANLFYWRANDLVVDTRSMYGGALRRQRLWHLEENRHVTHVNYFRRFETAQVVQRGLFRDDADTTGFNSRKPKGVDRGHVDVGEPTENTNQTAVILLPGIMGSHLSVLNGNKGNRIWLDKSDLMKGRGRKLAMDSGLEVVAAGVLKSPYDDFRDDLARHEIHVMPMAYDWRLSLDLAVELLDKLVTERLAASTKPIHLMAHSMGGLVASLFMVRCPNTWSQLKNGGGRLVQAGTPNLGSYVIPRILQGEEKMIRLIAMLDLDAGLNKWTAWTSRFPGLLELAPSFGDLDFSRVQTWKDLKVRDSGVPRASDLTAAAAVKQALVDQTEKLADEGVLYVAGGPNDTPIYDPDSKEIRFTERGDGRVTWDSGIPPGAPTWYIPAKHGSLLDSKRAFDGLRELLLTGQTTQLATDPPAASSLLRGAPLEAPALAPRDQIEFIPSADDLEEAALGMDESFGDQEPAGPPVSPCKISIVHGDLRFSENPVVVGHYRGDQIVHAESVLDRCLNNALQSRHQLGVYPGEVGDAEVLLKQKTTSKRQHGPTGAIILGLGNVGELTPGGLTRSVEAGLLRYAQACRERGRETSSLKITALLVGTGEAGITLLQAIDAFLDGVANANRALDRLRTGDGGDSEPEPDATLPLMHFSHLEFTELYNDLALEALHTLSAAPNRPEFTVVRKLVRRGGGRHRPWATQSPAWWPRIQILSRGNDDTDDALYYTVYGDRARAPVVKLPVQKALVDSLVAATLRDRNGSGELPGTLFELLVPPSMKAGAKDRANLQIVLDEGSAAYPWELLTDQRSRKSGQTGIGTGILRQLRISDVDIVSHPEKNQILVVGDPPSSMVELPGAQREAAVVAELFEKRDGWDVVKQIRAASDSTNISASSIIQSLLTNDVRILHLAGHGVYDASNSLRTGMVIGGSNTDDDPFILITAAEVKQMRLQPELVFINCCHLGRIENTTPFHKLAANVAAQFIRSGVKAVVAAGWPVNDEAGEIFCAEFYKQMLDGADFGTAVNAARGKTYQHESNTWGAYQCYGDPGFRLLMDLNVRSRVTGAYYNPDRYLDPTELVIELGNLVSRAKVQNSKEEKETLTKRSDELRVLADRKGWLDEPNVLTRLARVYGELGNFEIAIDLYEQAAGIEDGGVTLSDLERLANFRTRHGKNQNDGRLIDRTIRDLKRLIKHHGETAERLSLLGAAYKRHVQLVDDPAKVQEGLLAMTKAYMEATDLKADDWYYPATNALLGVLLLGGPWKRAPRKESESAEVWNALKWARRELFEDILDQVHAALRRREFETFWDAAAIPDLAVVRALADGNIDEKMSELTANYRGVIDLFGSGREVDSVINQWSFATETAEKLGERSIAEKLKSLADALSE